MRLAFNSLRAPIGALISLVCLTAAWPGTVLAQSSAFTYQGKLTSNALPAEGLHDFRFKLFDAASGGTQIGTTQCTDNLLVGGGVFMATLDFGAASFVTSGQRFLEIEVRADTGLNCSNVGGFVVLAPRQPVTPTPTATHAKTAFALAAADGSPAQAVFVDNNGNVGIGTTNPGTPLHIVSTSPVAAIHVASPFAVMNLQDTGAIANQTGYVSYRNQTGTETAWIGFGTAGDPDFSIINARPSGDIVLNPFSGNVGIGTASPTSKLQVNGDIRLGPAGQYRAPACEENLRIIRGTVDLFGNVVRGSGFTAQRIDTGKYTLTFTTPFTAIPSVTVSGEREFGTDATVANVDHLSPISASQVTIITWSTFLDTYNDRQFDFIAIGPR